MRTWWCAALAIACLSAGLVVGAAGPAGAGAHPRASSAVAASACGDRPGVKATGTPIILGSIDTLQAGTAFTDVQNMAAAYFACVNANGGVHGHPIRYFPMTDQTNPSQIESIARQLVTVDHVMGIVGVSSILECGVNAAYWKRLGFAVIGAGMANDPACWSTSTTASVTMGPRFSSDGATNYALSHGARKIVFDQANVPGDGYVAAGPRAVAAARHVPFVEYAEDVPLTSADAVAIKLVDAAGRSGAVVLDMSPPEALFVLQAAQHLGLENKVRLWACASECDTDFLAQWLGPKWNGRLFINADVTPLDGSTSRVAQLYRAVLAKYGGNVSGGVGAFSEAGFLDAELAVTALETIKGAYTARTVNAAFRAIKNVNTGMLCQAFTYGGYAEHIPNNMDYTVTPKRGKLVVVQGCALIPGADPLVAAYREAAGTG
jgi:branched-chain amino acid transport system substrate-binding protein